MRKLSETIRRRGIIGLCVASTLLNGCSYDQPAVSYLGEQEFNDYRGHAMEVAYPSLDQPLPDEVANTAPPHTIHEREDIPIRDISLAEAIQTALQNGEIIRTAGTFLSTGNTILNSPNNAPSVYDPAITDSGVLFGTRGVEAALAAFDAQLNASMTWGRNETIQNNPFFGGGLAGGGTLTNETGAFQAALSKTFANGSSISINHNVNYLGNNVPNQLFSSTYTGNLGLSYRLPLLAGSGTEYTRIAGPIGQQFGGLSGVSQGVLIARINNDISIADFEASVRNLIKDVEDAYWDLYLAYRNYHTAVTAKDSSLVTWRIADLQQQAGVLTLAEVAQARDQYYATEAASLNSRSNIYTTEVRLRRLIGLPANDGTTLRPLDEPVTAQLIPDWYACLSEALTKRVELRRQKWNMKSLDLQLKAARSLVKPRLDFVGGYQVNGFGDDLLGYGNGPLDNYYSTLAQGDQTGWNLGVQFQWNIGFRSALAQVRNYELRVAKSQRVLAEQEKEITHELAAAFQEVARAWSASQLNMNRLIAARENVRLLEPNIQLGDLLLDDLLRAQLRQAEAEVAYYQSVVEYNKSLNDFQLRKGTLLEYNNIRLLEGGWDAEAYQDADHIANHRNHARPNPLLGDDEPPFAVPGPTNVPYFTSPAAATPEGRSIGTPALAPMEDIIPAAPTESTEEPAIPMSEPDPFQQFIPKDENDPESKDSFGPVPPMSDSGPPPESP